MTSNQPQKGFVLWMTGLSGSGKTTISMLLEKELLRRGLRVERLDGDIIRKSLTRDLGFSKEDREKNIERVTFVAKLLSRNGIACICSFISPYQSIRDQVRSETTNFVEVYVEASLESVMERDVKGLYKGAIDGSIPNFTGISDPYEAPLNPDIHVRTDIQTPEESAQAILDTLERTELITAAEI